MGQPVWISENIVGRVKEMIGRGEVVLQGRGEKTGWVRQEAKWEACLWGEVLT